jgi:hypothetical protein
VKYLLVICKEVIMRLKCYVKMSELNLHLLNDSGSQLKTYIFLITIAKLRLGVMCYDRISRN